MVTRRRPQPTDESRCGGRERCQRKCLAMVVLSAGGPRATTDWGDILSSFTPRNTPHMEIGGGGKGDSPCWQEVLKWRGRWPPGLGGAVYAMVDGLHRADAESEAAVEKTVSARGPSKGKGWREKRKTGEWGVVDQVPELACATAGAAARYGFSAWSVSRGKKSREPRKRQGASFQPPPKRRKARTRDSGRGCAWCSSGRRREGAARSGGGGGGREGGGGWDRGPQEKREKSEQRNVARYRHSAQGWWCMGGRGRGRVKQAYRV